jgi:hypothetical protein
VPIIINEVEIFDTPTPSSPPTPSVAAGPREPAHDQLRRLQQDLNGRERRLIAD